VTKLLTLNPLDINTLDHDILIFSKVFNSSISIENLKEINPKLFEDLSLVKQSLDTLHSLDLITFDDDDHWTITSFGVHYLYQMVK